MSGFGGPDRRGRADPYRRRTADGAVLANAWVVLGISCGVLVLVLGIRDGQPIDIVTGLIVIAICAALSRPSRQAIARWRTSRRPAPDLDAPVVIFWRPDDLRSARLRKALKDLAHRVVWVNTWSSKLGEERVRAINGGEEIVPTVTVNGEALSGASAAEVREAILTNTDERGPQGQGPQGQ